MDPGQKRSSEPGSEAAEPSPGEASSGRRMTSVDQRRKKADEIDAEVQSPAEAERTHSNEKTARLRAAR